MDSIKELKRKLIKSRFFNGLLMGVLCASLAFAAATKFTDLTVTGDLIVSDDSTFTDDISVGGNLTLTGTLAVTDTSTLTGNTSVTGTLGVTGVTSVSSATISQRLLLSTTANAISTFTATAIGLDDGLTLTIDGLVSLPSAADPNTSVTPTRAGQIMYDSSTGDVCMATAAVANSWVFISTPTTKCAS